MIVFAYLGMLWVALLTLALVWFVVSVSREAWKERQLRKRIAEELAKDPYAWIDAKVRRAGQ